MPLGQPLGAGLVNRFIDVTGPPTRAVTWGRDWTADVGRDWTADKPNRQQGNGQPCSSNSNQAKLHECKPQAPTPAASRAALLRLAYVATDSRDHLLSLRHGHEGSGASPLSQARPRGPRARNRDTRGSTGKQIHVAVGGAVDRGRRSRHRRFACGGKTSQRSARPMDAGCQ
jgi:hypothetical protein